MQPIFYDYSDVKKQINKNGTQVFDEIDLAIDELFDIAYPDKKDTKSKADVQEFKKKLLSDKKVEEWGEWVLYPWLNYLVHIPSKDEYRALRTSRNRNLITESEQKVLMNKTICIAGLSVGSNVVEAIVSQGIGCKLQLADMDNIEPTNLNRIRSPYYHVGLPKIEAISRKAWEIDPYLEIEGLSEGITVKSLESLSVSKVPDIIVDEVDDLKAKVLIREFAKKHRLPVLMAADDGDNSLIDIERYDINHNLPIFAGRIPSQIIDRIKNDDIPRKEIGQIIGQYFIGTENIPERMMSSLEEVGKSLPSWPQLGGAAALSGVAVAYAVKRIILGQHIREGRVLISLDEKLAL